MILNDSNRSGSLFQPACLPDVTFSLTQGPFRSVMAPLTRPGFRFPLTSSRKTTAPIGGDYEAGGIDAERRRRTRR